MRTAKTLLVAILPLALALSVDDAPEDCEAICSPVGELFNQCDPLVDVNDAQKLSLKNQCFCSNKSFRVREVTPLCADCMAQNGAGNSGEDRNVDMDSADPRKLMAACSFAGIKYSPAATSLVADITVIGTPVSEINQPPAPTKPPVAPPPGAPGAPGAPGGPIITTTATKNNTVPLPPGSPPLPPKNGTNGTVPTQVVPTKSTIGTPSKTTNTATAKPNTPANSNKNITNPAGAKAGGSRFAAADVIFVMSAVAAVVAGGMILQ